MTDATKALIHSFISSHLNYCNSPLASLPDNELQKLQSIQNVMARLVPRFNKFDHTTPILIDLH